MVPTESEILTALRSRRYRPMNAEELAQHLGVTEPGAEEFYDLIERMRLEGKIVEVKFKCLALPEKVDLVVGLLRMNPSGFGFILPLSSPSEDLYVGAQDMGTAFDGDTVVARIKKTYRPGRRGRNIPPSSAATVVSVIKRARSTVVGTFQRTRKFCYVIPDDPRMPKDIYIAPEDTLGAEPRQKVVARIIEWSSEQLNPEGEIIEVLGSESDPRVETTSVVRQFELPDRFEEDVLAEAAERSRAPFESDLAGRLDLRKALTITIDPDDAKDFDDAVTLEQDARGQWRLGVHIADVSNYVKPETPLDAEALRRGTSVYLPGLTIPMLPEALSNGACSLREGEDRLTKSVLMTCAKSGELLASEVRKSVIRSSRRLTYRQALKLIEHPSAEAASDLRAIAHMLHRMRDLALVLRQRRLDRGAIDLDLSELAVRVDAEGRVKHIEKIERDIAHSLIEEFMLAANEAVARFMTQHHLPFISRVHAEPDPESLADFQAFVRALGYNLPDPRNVKQIQALLREAEGRGDKYAVNYSLLRSLKQAEYSAEPGLHYALATKHYCHFTSPIRRYPDLVVHRMLDEYFAERLESSADREAWQRRMPDWAAHSSFTERRAQDAERELTKLKIMTFLEDKMGEEMRGIVVGIREFGMFVQLADYLIDGLVRLSTMRNDFYRLDRARTFIIGERSRRRYKIGDSVTVILVSLNFVRREVDLTIVEDGDSPPRQRRR